MAELHRDLLIELGTEELPPKALSKLSDAFRSEIVKALSDAELSFGTVHSYASPRRLALVIEQLQVNQADREIERKGPALAAAYDKDGQPTKAALGFARSCGVDIGALSELRNEQGAWLVYRGVQSGQPARRLIPGMVSHALSRLPIPKRMRWGAGSAQFVRPVHWLVLLHGDELIEAEILGVKADRYSYGHRFHAPGALAISAPADYSRQLEQQGRVIADFDRRRQLIREQIAAVAAEAGAEAVVEEGLLDEVTALVEWPVALIGRFDEHFLDVPAEALISSMQEHQKYFPLRDASGRLLPSFITIANIDSRDPAAVRAGNERVIRPRLADAAFFWEQDRKRPLASHLDALKQVVYQAELGSLYEKSRRVAALASAIAEVLRLNSAEAERAGWLGKCDLQTAMVGEFPELQGIMGRYYAVHDGEPEAVALALDEQYMPRFGGDRIAGSATGRVLAVAERADTLLGIFAIGRAPSGDKDPFALRRAALGLMRSLIEGELDLDLEWLLEQAALHLPGKLDAGAQVQAVLDFCLERLRGYYHEQGVEADLFEAVAALKPTRPLDFHQRIEACLGFAKLPEAASLAAANKRIRNILRKAEDTLPAALQSQLLVEPAEQALAAALTAAQSDAKAFLQQRDYGRTLERLAALGKPVDAFFDDVMVMAEEPAVRGNRLKLLQEISHTFLEVADVSHLRG